uniref:Uncharacterized protein n=1 Tax=Panagrolaimus superbus TaxID=310955 RepID=A0A914YFQ6_9BILA
MNKLSSKLWITGALTVYPKNAGNDSVASSIVPKIYRCDLKRLNLYDQVISLKERIFLCSYVKDLILNQVTVKYDNGTVVAFEKLIEQFPQLNVFEFTFTTPSNNISKNTFKELWKISYLSNYHCFYLYNIPENFEIDSFYSYMKKNKNTRVSLEFSDQISEEYKARLEAIVDEIIETQNHEYKPPYIKFPGMNGEKRNILLDIFFR